MADGKRYERRAVSGVASNQYIGIWSGCLARLPTVGTDSLSIERAHAAVREHETIFARIMSKDNSTPTDESTDSATDTSPPAANADESVDEPTDSGQPSPPMTSETVAAELSNVRIQVTDADTPLTVEAISDEAGWSGVDLRWQTEHVDIGVTVEPPVARELAAALIGAAETLEDS